MKKHRGAPLTRMTAEYAAFRHSIFYTPHPQVIVSFRSRDFPDFVLEKEGRCHSCQSILDNWSKSLNSLPYCTSRCYSSNDDLKKTLLTDFKAAITCLFPTLKESQCSMEVVKSSQYVDRLQRERVMDSYLSGDECRHAECALIDQRHKWDVFARKWSKSDLAFCFEIPSHSLFSEDFHSWVNSLKGNGRLLRFLDSYVVLPSPKPPLILSGISSDGILFRAFDFFFLFLT
jgi:hypothetical protein